MDAELQQLLQEYRRVLTLQHFREEDLDYSALERHLPMLERLDLVEDSSVLLYDLYRRKYQFLTRSFRFLIGFDREAVLDEGPDALFRRMHPDDLPRVLDTIVRCFRFLYGLPPPERRDYKLGFDFRIRQADGSYVRLVQQIVVLELDRRGNIWLVLAVNDRVRGSSAEAPSHRQLVNLKNGRYYLFLPAAAAEDGTNPSLSRREIEVLGLVAVGLASRQIADRPRSGPHRQATHPGQDAGQKLRRSGALRLAARHHLRAGARWRPATVWLAVNRRPGFFSDCGSVA